MLEAQSLAGLHRFHIRPFASNLGFLNGLFVMETFHSVETDSGDKAELLAEAWVLAQMQGNS